MIACANCGHPDDAHPILGGGYGGPASSKMVSPCERCDCPGFVSPKRAHLPLEPSRADVSGQWVTGPEEMHAILSDEGSDFLCGEATHYFWFDDHPRYGFQGQQLMRGISGHEVPGHMRNMMSLTDRGDVIFRLRKG